MTSYSVDNENGSLVRTWRTRADCLAGVVVQFPAEATAYQRRAMVMALTQLSEQLWRAYARSGIPTSGRVMRGRRTRLTELLGKVVGVVRPSMAGTPRQLTPEYEAVVDRARAVADRLKEFDDDEVQEALIREVEAEADAVDRADRGFFAGRAGQATMISRTFIVMSQVRTADGLLRKCLTPEPTAVAIPELSALGVFDRLDPSAAAAAGLQWFKAAADVVADAAGIGVDDAVWRAHDQRELSVAVLQAGVSSIVQGRSAAEAAVYLVAQALDVSDGLFMTVAEIQTRVDTAVTGYFGNADTDDITVPLLLLPTRDPAWELLQACLTGIGACYAAFDAMMEQPHAAISEDGDGHREDGDDEWREEVLNRFVALLQERLERNHAQMLG
ncbi:hypothetical protein [Actinoplanes sp. NPDC020271]|uniref:hypothetical protein n=1 Tax=Actinoplanes sp. NPDC020271 TaxID=3363896 RepID=UPI00379C59A2